MERYKLNGHQKGSALTAIVGESGLQVKRQDSFGRSGALCPQKASGDVIFLGPL